MRPSPSSSPPPWTVWEILGLTVFVLVVFFSITSAIASLFITLQLSQDPTLDPQVVARSVEGNGFVLSIATIIAGSCSSGLIYYLLKRRPASTIKQYLALRTPRWPSWLIWNGLLIALIQLSDSILRAFKHKETFTESLYQTSHNPVLLYIAIVGIAPLFEELLFRGFLFQGLQSSPLGASGAIVISALLWAILHVQYGLLVISQIFVFGLFFGVARWRTHSLFIPLSMHCINNFLALLITSLKLQ